MIIQSVNLNQIQNSYKENIQHLRDRAAWQAGYEVLSRCRTPSVEVVPLPKMGTRIDKLHGQIYYFQSLKKLYSCISERHINVEPTMWSSIVKKTRLQAG